MRLLNILVVRMSIIQVRDLLALLRMITSVGIGEVVQHVATT